jgi:uncharacterized protein (DUF2126 family)
VARFWARPYTERLVHWDTRLHDEFMLPHFVVQDLRDVIEDLNGAGYPFRTEWFAPFVEFRFPRYGTVAYEGVELELRQAIEPWHVLGEYVAQTGMSRYVDSSVERLQVKATRLNASRYAIACNGRMVPMTATGHAGEYVAGRALPRVGAAHGAASHHRDPYAARVRPGGHVERALGRRMRLPRRPSGRTQLRDFPRERARGRGPARRALRHDGPYAGPMNVEKEARNPRFPVTLDLRRAPAAPS